MKSYNKIFVGYDPREDEAYKTCVNSIRKTSPWFVSIADLIQSDLRKQGHYYRDIDPLSSTEFSFSRFLVPHLTDFEGWHIFCDCDFVFMDDINKIFDMKNEKYAVMVCKHDYKPKNDIKMDGKIQHLYPRKNWSSLVLWNSGHPSNKSLTKEVVNTETGQFLHRFSWLKDEEIGEIPIQWNWLVNWYKEPEDGSPKALHFTEGGPWFKGYENCEYADVYNKYKI